MLIDLGAKYNELSKQNKRAPGIIAEFMSVVNAAVATVMLKRTIKGILGGAKNMAERAAKEQQVSRVTASYLGGLA